MEHGLAGLKRTSDSQRPIVVCKCGCIASGKPGVTWTVGDVAGFPGRCYASPSFDWKGHFHEYAVNVPWIEWPENYRSADECMAEEVGAA